MLAEKSKAICETCKDITTTTLKNIKYTVWIIPEQFMHVYVCDNCNNAVSLPDKTCEAIHKRGMNMRMYIAVLDTVPKHMVPVLVAHSVLSADAVLTKAENLHYLYWKVKSYKKCVVSVNQKEFDRISNLPDTYLGYENSTLEGKYSCAVAVPVFNDEVPNVLKFAKLWKP